MAMTNETVHRGAPHPGTELCVMRTRAGFYLGYKDKDGTGYTRETFYMPKTEAEKVLRGLNEGDPVMVANLKLAHFR